MRINYFEETIFIIVFDDSCRLLFFVLCSQKTINQRSGERIFQKKLRKPLTSHFFLENLILFIARTKKLSVYFEKLVFTSKNYLEFNVKATEVLTMFQPMFTILGAAKQGLFCYRI